MTACAARCINDLRIILNTFRVSFFSNRVQTFLQISITIFIVVRNIICNMNIIEMYNLPNICNTVPINV